MGSSKVGRLAFNISLEIESKLVDLLFLRPLMACRISDLDKGISKMSLWWSMLSFTNDSFIVCWSVFSIFGPRRLEKWSLQPLGDIESESWLLLLSKFPSQIFLTISIYFVGSLYPHSSNCSNILAKNLTCCCFIKFL